MDSAAQLQDRASTAIFLADTKNPNEMMRLQREDAVARLKKVNPRGLFPVRMPSAANRVVVAVLIAAGLLEYRVHHKPPLISLLQSTERSQLVQSVLTPIVHAMEKDLQRTVALVTKEDDSTDEVRAGENNPPPDDLWQNGEDKQNDTQNGDQGAPDAGPDDEQQNQASSSGNQTPSSNNSSESQQQQQGGAQSQQSQNASSSAQEVLSQQQQQESKEGAKKPVAGATFLMQALKDTMSNPQKQDSNNNTGNQPSQDSNAQGQPQSGNANSTNGNPNGQKGDSRGSSDAQTKPSESASTGAGSQAGLKQKRVDFDSHQVTAVPDRVALETGTYKEQMRMRTETEAGTAQMAVHDVTSQSEAVVNGAEQENIPARDRAYVQHYFEHTDAGQQDSTLPAGTPPVNTQPDSGEPPTGQQ